MSYFFFILLLLAPILSYYGIDKQWTLIFMDVGSATLLFCLVAAALRRRRRLLQVPGLLPLGLFLLFVGLQLVPLPPVLLSLVSPTAYKNYQQSVWLLEPGAWMPLSIHAKASLEQLVRLASYTLIYIATIQLINSPDRLRKTTYILTLFGGGYAFFSLLQKFVTGERIFWFLAEWAEMEARGAGSYANYNHHAGLLEMLFPLALVYFLLLGAQREQLSWRERIAAVLKSAAANRYFLAGSAALLIFVAIMFSLSRGGTISLLLATLFLLVMLISSQKFKGKSFLVLLLVVCAFGLVTEFGWQPIIKKFSYTFDDQGELTEQRPQYWLDSLNTMADYPLFGTGAGSFQDAYTRYQTVPTGTKYVRFAHNDYVELLTDTGLLGTSLVVWFLATLIVRTWQAWRRRHSRTSSYIYLGALSGVLSILFHSVTDFNLKIPPNAQFLFFLFGLMVAAANLRSGGSQGKSDLPIMPNVQGKLLLSACLVVLLTGLFVNAGGLYARSLYEAVREQDLDQPDPGVGQESLQQIQRAAFFDPLEGRYRYTEAKLLDSLGFETLGLERYGQILRLRPYRGLYLQRAGSLAATLDDQDLAGLLLREAVAVQPTFFERRLEYARWLLGQERHAEALAVLRIGLQQYPEETKFVLPLLAAHQQPPEALRDGLPDRSRSWQVYADYLAAQDAEVEAESAYLRAIDLLATEKRPSVSVYWSYFNYLQERGRDSEALNLLLAGTETFPAYAPFHRTAGRLYAEQGITYRAIEEFELALKLNPRDRWTRQQLEKLQDGGH